MREKERCEKKLTKDVERLEDEVKGLRSDIARERREKDGLNVKKNELERKVMNMRWGEEKVKILRSKGHAYCR